MKFSIILGNLNACSDRYMQGGYNTSCDLAEMFKRYSELEGVDGVELVGDWQVCDDNLETVQRYVKDLRISVVGIIPNHFGSAIWGKGAFTSPELAVRKKAVEETVKTANWARALDCPTVGIWNGQDGYDYPFQVNYMDTSRWLVDGVREAASQVPDINISLEYKPKEPRNHCFIPNVWSAVYISEKTGLDNVGVTIDVGHSFEAYENVSEAFCIASSAGKLMHIHINDNYRLWDDDMMTGSVHTIEFIELFYWLRKVGYNGYVSIDQYPYREDSKGAAQESLRWLHTFSKAASLIDEGTMEKILSGHDAVASTRYLRELLFSF